MFAGGGLAFCDQIMDALAVAHDATVQMIDTSIIHNMVPSSPITAAIVVFFDKTGRQ
jgi:hypothetical protein